MEYHYETYLAYEIQAYQERAENGQLLDFCTIVVIAENEDQAIKKAKTLINKSNYRISNIIENFTKKDYVTT